MATVEYEGGQHFIKDVDYNYRRKIKLMYKAVNNDIERKH
jgi:RNA polymerase sigma-70 factor (ECF subfamily)